MSFGHDALREMDKLPSQISSLFLHYRPPESCLRFSDVMNFSGLLLAIGYKERKMCEVVVDAQHPTLLQRISETMDEPPILSSDQTVNGVVEEQEG